MKSMANTIDCMKFRPLRLLFFPVVFFFVLGLMVGAIAHAFYLAFMAVTEWAWDGDMEQALNNWRPD